MRVMPSQPCRLSFCSSRRPVHVCCCCETLRALLYRQCACLKLTEHHATCSMYHACNMHHPRGKAWSLWQHPRTCEVDGARIGDAATFVQQQRDQTPLAAQVHQADIPHLAQQHGAWSALQTRCQRRHGTTKTLFWWFVLRRWPPK